MNAAVLITPGNGVRFQWRTARTARLRATNVSGVVAPCWLKLAARPNSFAAYYSSNGLDWTQVGTSQTIAMASSATLGLAVTSHADGTLCTSTMDNVTVGPPAQPTGLSATPGNKQVALSWTASSGAASYNLKRATVNGGPYTTVTNVTTTSCTNPGLTNGTTYYYVVSALNAGGESANSSQASATPTNRPPVLVNDSYTVNEDSTSNLAVLVNDSDPDGTPLTLVSVSTTNGTAAAVGTNVVYTSGNGTVADTSAARAPDAYFARWQPSVREHDSTRCSTWTAAPDGTRRPVTDPAVRNQLHRRWPRVPSMMRPCWRRFPTKRSLPAGRWWSPIRPAMPTCRHKR